ncbi:MAG: hypothetical protein KGN78_08110 [Actinomycetales bacterium]|nr:hypothetical protein [Actinomycetales bacterium]
MADQEGAKSSGKSGTPRGVRGPQGPARPATTPSRRSSAGRPQRQRPQIPASPNDSLLVRYSRRPLTWLHSAPRWLIVIVMALALVAGLILSGPFTVLGGALLILVALLLLWLLALAWPVLNATSRVIRVFAVASLTGVGVLKILGML